MSYGAKFLATTFSGCAVGGFKAMFMLIILDMIANQK